MKRFLVAAAVVVACKPTSQQSNTPVIRVGAEDAGDATVLAAVLEMNDTSKYGAPPTEFRKGHVTPRELPEEAVTRTKEGYVIALPSRAPIATPAVYEGRLYVSGGFRSREFYAFDATSG